VAITIRPALTLCLALLPFQAQAQTATFENIDRLEARVVGALGADIGTPGGPAAPIDRRMKLARCPVPAMIDPPALGALAIRCEPIGWRIRVPMTYAATPMAVKAQPVVRKGDPVELFVQTSSFSVSTGAIAQEDGAMGDRIRIKSDPAAPVMIAEVVDSGRVRMPGFK
jgi:flagellar basal body P-ring formation protein FlgA